MCEKTIFLLFACAAWKVSAEDISGNKYKTESFKIVGLNMPPYVEFDACNKFQGGFELEILKTISQKINVRYELIQPIELNFGEGRKGNWSGFFGRIQRQEADFGIPSIFVKQNLRKILDFTTPHRFARITFAVRAPRSQAHLTAIVGPFTFGIWTLVVVSVAVVGTTLQWIMKIESTQSKSENIFKTRKVYWYLFGSFTNQGWNLKMIRRNSSRVMIGFWWLSVIVIVSAYTGTFMSFVISPVLDPIPTTFEELETAVANGYYKCGTLKTGGADTFFEGAKDGTANILNQHMRKDPSNLVNSIEQGINRVLKDNFVFIEEENVIAFTAINSGIHDIIISREAIVVFPAAFGIRKGLKMKDNIDKILSRIYECGIVRKLLEEELHRSTSLLTKPEPVGYEPLGIKFFLSPFLLLGFGYILATLCLIAEVLYYNVEERINIFIDTI